MQHVVHSSNCARQCGCSGKPTSSCFGQSASTRSSFRGLWAHLPARLHHCISQLLQDCCRKVVLFNTVAHCAVALDIWCLEQMLLLVNLAHCFEIAPNISLQYCSKLLHHRRWDACRPCARKQHLAAQKPPGQIAITFEKDEWVLHIGTMLINELQPLFSGVLPQQIRSTCDITEHTQA
jgi:hypothetical protein